ncbi:hypothetical protein D3C84_582230 [compost metagenome]
MPSQAGSDCCRVIARAIEMALCRLLLIPALASAFRAFFCFVSSSLKLRTCSQRARK